MRPGENGQAGGVLQDRDKSARFVDRKDGHRAAVGAASQSASSPQGDPDFGLRVPRFGSESFNESFEGMPRDSNRAVIALS